MAMNSTSFEVDDVRQAKQGILVLVLSKILIDYLYYLPLFFYILGFLGFIGNLVTYLQPELRTNTCCIYSLCGSVVDIIYLSLNALPDFLYGRFNLLMPWSTSVSSCRMMFFLFACLPNLSLNFLVMSMIDRYACTCELTSKMHRLNQMKVIPKTIALTILISCLASIYAIIMIVQGWTGACIYANARIYTSLNIAMNGIIPPVVMLIFVLLTYRNIYRSRQRVVGFTDDWSAVCTFLFRMPSPPQIHLDSETNSLH